MQIIGHRGASGYKPENTLAAFKQAIELGVDMIELDVYVLKSGEVVVFHDDRLERTTNGKGKIESKTFSDICKLDAGEGEKVPLLTEVLDVVNKRVAVNIELKGKHTAHPVAKIIQQYTDEKKWSSDLFIVSAFDHNELRLFSNHLPTVRTGALYKTLPIGFWSKLQHSGVFSANLSAKVVTGRAVKAAHSRGLKVFAYTVNTKRQAERMARLNVDGIFSDYPDRACGGNCFLKSPQTTTIAPRKKVSVRAN